MSNVNFTILKDYGKLSANGDIFFRYINWNGYKKYDLRKWDETGTTPYKGITIDPEEIDSFFKLLLSALNEKKNKTAVYTSSLGKATANILNVFGSFSDKKNDMSKRICFIDWGRSAKYDIRPWNDNFTACGKGVTLNEQQLQCLFNIVSNSILLDGIQIDDLEEKEYDTL